MCRTYPLTHLQPAEVRKLRSFLTPNQALRIQLAAPMVNNLEPLQPITVLREAELVALDAVPQKVFFHHRHHGGSNMVFPIENSEGRVVWAKRQLEVTNVAMWQFGEKHIFDNVYLTPEVLRLSHCSVSLQWINRLKLRICGTVKEVNFFASKLASDFTTKTLCEEFPHFAHLILFNTTLQPTWVNSFLEAGKTNLLYMSISGEFENVFGNVDMTNFHQFIKAQPNKFKMFFTINKKPDIEQVESTLHRLFDDQFQLVSSNQDDANIDFKVMFEYYSSKSYVLRIPRS